MSYVAWFKNLNRNSIPVAGGKGANLGEMFNLGMPVPPGFVVTAQTYASFIERTKIKDKILKFLEDLNVEDTKKLQAVAKSIQKLISSTKVPKDIAEEIKKSYSKLYKKEAFVAVRSSATAEDLPSASFAGQQATFLNVKGKPQLIKAVSGCWASLFTARAIYYRVKNNFSHDKVLIAVVIQKMVNSSKSGIMFSIDPSTNNPKNIVIEAVYGLGEAIVSGEVNPDLYIVNKDKLRIEKIELKKKDWGLFRNAQGKNFKKKLSEKEAKSQVLSEAQVRELAAISKNLEQHYSKPQDSEWAVENEKIYLVQTRPVTTFKPKEEQSQKEYSAKILLRGETAAAGFYCGNVRIIYRPSKINKIQKGDILVTTMTTPDFVPAMEKAGAIVTDEGGLTCHAAIVSREMGTPCIVGTEVATKVLKDNQLITVDATHGLVYEGKLEQKMEQKAALAISKLHTKTKVKVIMDLPDKAESAAKTGADGVGLVRLEIMIASGGIHPAEYIRTGKERDYINLLKTGIRKIAKAFASKPVWIRCSDMRSDEYRGLKGGEKEPKETDPMIGWHGIRRLLDEPGILKAEFKAIKELHEEGWKNVGIMIPFIIRTEELQAAKKIMRQLGLDPVKQIDFGIMVETPAACWLIEELCKEGISFVSFGTNDLTQLTLGIDRNNGKLSNRFDEMHPAVLGEIAQVIKVCKKYGVTTSICGQAGSRPEMATFLVHQGADSISANPDAVGKIRQVVSEVEKKLGK